MKELSRQDWIRKDIEIINKALGLDDTNKLYLTTRYNYYAIDKIFGKGADTVKTGLSIKEVEIFISGMIEALSIMSK